MSADTSMPRWAQAGLIGIAGVGVVIAVWLLQPKKPALGPVDFKAGGPDALQFCDPQHPKFIPVASKASPVVLAAAGSDVLLKTATGKILGADDLVGGHLRLLAVNQAMTQFQVGDATYSGKGGLWIWPVPAGTTRLFADFTPVANGNEMYASCVINDADGGAQDDNHAGLQLDLPPSVTAGQELTVTVRNSEPGLLPPAVTLAAFDIGRQGPTGCVVKSADGNATDATFHLTFSDPGMYIVWAASGDRKGRAVLRVQP